MESNYKQKVIEVYAGGGEVNRAEKEGLKRIKITGVDFLLLEDEIASFTEEQREIWFQYADLVAGSEYAAALSNHALFICKKSS